MTLRLATTVAIIEKIDPTNKIVKQLKYLVRCNVIRTVK